MPFDTTDPIVRIEKLELDKIGSAGEEKEKEEKPLLSKPFSPNTKISAVLKKISQQPPNISP